ncbi:hypothetical protein Tco_1064147 [Tanacetum coccineum]
MWDTFVLVVRAYEHGEYVDMKWQDEFLIEIIIEVLEEAIHICNYKICDGLRDGSEMLIGLGQYAIDGLDLVLNKVIEISSCTSEGKPLALPWGRIPRLDSGEFSTRVSWYFAHNYSSQSRTLFGEGSVVIVSMDAGSLLWNATDLWIVLRKLPVVYPRPLCLRMTKVIKGEFEKIMDVKIEDVSLTCNAPLEVYNNEVNRLSRMDNDSEHEADDDMGYDPSDVAFIEWLGSKIFNYNHYTIKALWIYWIRGDDEVELTDEESSDDEDNII